MEKHVPTKIEYDLDLAFSNYGKILSDSEFFSFVFMTSLNLKTLARLEVELESPH